MAFINKARVKDTTSTTGNGPYTMIGTSVTNFQNIVTAMAIGDTAYVMMVNRSAGEWMGAYMTRTDSTLVYNSLVESSTGARITFGAGIKDCYIYDPAAISGSLKTIVGLTVDSTDFTTSQLTLRGARAAVGAGITVAMLGGINFDSNDTSIVSILGATVASIRAIATGNHNVSSLPTVLVFYATAAALIVPEEVLRLATPSSTFSSNVIVASGERVVLGPTISASTLLYISSPIVGATTSYGMYVNSVVQDTVATAYAHRTLLATLAAAFTLANMHHYSTAQGTIGVGSVVTHQTGFYVDPSLVGATNNYGFFSNIPTATNRWNVYAAGTAWNYFAGSVGIGSTALTQFSLRVTQSIVGSTTAYGIAVDATVASTVTLAAYAHHSSVTTSAAAFTLTTLAHYVVVSPAKGAGSTITNQYGFHVTAAMTTGTNNYAFSSLLAAATGVWNIYASGTAQNALAGLTRFGGVTVPVNTVDITGSFGRGAPVTKAADFTLAVTENWIINNKAAATCTATLPAASTCLGREIAILNYVAFTVVSASANVVPLGGGAAATAILAGTVGKWAILVSDGTNWVIMAAG